jgi:hypothetical protein
VNVGVGVLVGVLVGVYVNVGVLVDVGSGVCTVGAAVTVGNGVKTGVTPGAAVAVGTGVSIESCRASQIGFDASTAASIFNRELVCTLPVRSGVNVPLFRIISFTWDWVNNPPHMACTATTTPET